MTSRRLGKIGYIEPHACLVEVDGNGRVAVWSSNQGMFNCETSSWGSTPAHPSNFSRPEDHWINLYDLPDPLC
jgi:hypothetical protein